MRTSQKLSACKSMSAEKRSNGKKRQSGCGLAGSRRSSLGKPALCGVTKNDIRRLARKAGVKRIGLDTFDEARLALTSFLRSILKDVGVITEGARRMTATVPDVLLALKRNGRTLYGFGEINSLDQYADRIRKPVRQAALQRAAGLVQRQQAQQASGSQQPRQALSPPSQPSASAGFCCSLDRDRQLAASARADDHSCTGVQSVRGESQQGSTQQYSAGSAQAVPATPETPSQPSQLPISMTDEMRDHIQGSVGEYVAKVYKYDPPGSVYKVKDLHSWVASQYFNRKGLDLCSPEQLQTVLYALDEEGQVMISADAGDLHVRFVM